MCSNTKYIFKITKDATGTTGDPGTIIPGDPNPGTKALHPIIFDGITIELSKTELIILSSKKKNNKMKEIKESVMNKLYDIVDEDDVELLFDINATKNNISILCKRKIEC